VKKVGLLVLAVVVALGLLGAGFAYWQNTLTVTGSVHAANFAYTVVAEAHNVSTPGGVGSVTVVPSGTPGSPVGPFTVNFNNICPGYSGNVVFTLTNTGDVHLLVTAQDLSTVVWHGDLVLGEYLAAHGTFSSVGANPVLPGNTLVATIGIAVDPNMTETTLCGLSVDGTILLTVEQAH
jgi:hypothetical protein